MPQDHMHAAAAGDGASIAAFFSRLFDADFMPRAQCFMERPEVIWLHVISDGLVALAYYSIPIALIYFVLKRRDLVFNWMFVLFGLFILACGTTHVMSVLAIWKPVYRLDGVIKAATAVLSVGTATALWPLIPRALQLPSPDSLRSANLALGREVNERKSAQQALERAHQELEDRVRQRTTELSRANERLRAEVAERARIAQQLARSNADLQDFAYIVAHDLKEPLRGIRLTAGFLVEDYSDKLGDDGAQRLRSVDRLAGRMYELLDAMLFYARVGDSSVATGPVPLSGVVEQVVTQLRAAIDESGARVSVNQPLPVVAADPTLLPQVYFNLIHNAIKYNDADEKRIEIGSVPGDDAPVLYVRDNGIGIHPDHHATVFRMFKRLHTRDRYGGGTGVGLSIVKRIVERHGGRIWIESEAGKGTTFYFTLHPGSAETAPPIESEASPATNGDRAGPADAPNT